MIATVTFLAVLAVAAAAWDIARRYIDAREVDERAELEAQIAKVNERCDALANQLTQVRNRGAVSNLPTRRRAG